MSVNKKLHYTILLYSGFIFNSFITFSGFMESLTNHQIADFTKAIQQLQQGIFITIEGIDGSGKSTLSRVLTTLLTNTQAPVVTSREPGGTPIGKEIRKLLIAGNLDPKTEYLLFAADRRLHIEKVIKPALAKKKIVISDRFYDSSIIYQGIVRDLDLNILQKIHEWIAEKIKPDITFYISVPYEVAQERRQTRCKNNLLDQLSHDFYEKMTTGYENLARQHSQRYIILDGEKSSSDLALDAFNSILNWIQQRI